MNSNETPPPRYPSPVPQIPPQSRAPLELMLQPEEDDEPTIKTVIPPHLLEASRERDDSWQRGRGPNWGLLLALGFCLAFWGSVFFLFWRAHG